MSPRDFQARDWPLRSLDGHCPCGDNQWKLKHFMGDVRIKAPDRLPLLIPAKSETLADSLDCSMDFAPPPILFNDSQNRFHLHRSRSAVG